MKYLILRQAYAAMELSPGRAPRSPSSEFGIAITSHFVWMYWSKAGFHLKKKKKKKATKLFRIS